MVQCICNAKVTRTHSQIRIHRRVCHYKCTLRSFIFHQRANILNNSLYTCTVYACNRCFLIFPSQQLLFAHQKAFNHYRDKTHKCMLCTKSFTSNFKLQQHGMSVHGISVQTFKPFTCKKCHKQFADKQRLSRHYDAHEKKKKKKKKRKDTNDSFS